jgi:hypothetical protein
MATPHDPHNHEVFQEHPIITELLAELQAIEERRQYAVRLYTLMHQHSHLEIPVQYERLFLRSPAGKEEKKDDHRRRTHKSHRRWVPYSRG